MAVVYVSKESIQEAVSYFSSIDYNKPEQIGLFFYFKALKYNSREYIHYQTGNGQEKEENIRRLYDLAGIFDATCEEGGINTGLFPFSLAPTIKKTSFYNGRTVFKKLIGRIKDTIDNALIDENNYLRKDELDATNIKFKPNYIDILLANSLRGNKISLRKFATWYFRFYEFDVDDSWVEDYQAENFDAFTRLCTKKLIEELRLNANELTELFDTTDGIIKYSDNKITGEELRAMMTFEDDAIPEVTVAQNPANYMPANMMLERDEVLNLTTPHGNNITADSLEILLEKTLQAVLTGPPGTGKSHISNEIKERFDESFLIQFHPNLTYEQFIGGNSFDETGNVKAKAGVFLEFCEKARNDADHRYLFMIDEINRGNVSKIFGETILALDREYSVQLPMTLSLENGTPVRTFSIPKNVYILATMNSADRSIALVDYAIRRRFAFITFYPNSEVIDFLSDYSMLTGIRVGNLMDELNSKLLNVLGDSDLLLGQSYFIPKWAFDPESGKIKWTDELLRDLFNYYILPIIEEYTYGNKRYLTNIVGDKLSNRIMDVDEFIEELKIQFSR